MSGLLWFIGALVWTVILLVFAFITALRKPDDKEEAKRIKRLDEAMNKIRDDLNEPARFVK